MEKLIASLANLAGLSGVILCVISGASRVIGESYLMGYEGLSVFNGGVGLMVFAILAKQEFLIRNN